MRSSPYSLMILPSSCSLMSFTKASAVVLLLASIRMSSGPSLMNEKPLSARSSCTKPSIKVLIDRLKRSSNEPYTKRECFQYPMARRVSEPQTLRVHRTCMEDTPKSISTPFGPCGMLPCSTSVLICSFRPLHMYVLASEGDSNRSYGRTPVCQ